MTDLTPEQVADGWIAHDGGPCPVEKFKTVRAISMSGAEFAGRATAFLWRNIIAYKLEQPQ